MAGKGGVPSLAHPRHARAPPPHPHPLPTPNPTAACPYVQPAEGPPPISEDSAGCYPRKTFSRFRHSRNLRAHLPAPIPCGHIVLVPAALYSSTRARTHAHTNRPPADFPQELPLDMEVFYQVCCRAKLKAGCSGTIATALGLLQTQPRLTYAMVGSASAMLQAAAGPPSAPGQGQAGAAGPSPALGQPVAGAVPDMTSLQGLQYAADSELQQVMLQGAGRDSGSASLAALSTTCTCAKVL